MTAPALVWFRDDLRIADNPALHAAVATKKPVLAVFVLEEAKGGPRARGGAARWWLHGALESLAKNLEAKGGQLHLYRGDAAEIVPKLAKDSEAAFAFWSRRYDAGGQTQDATIEKAIRALDCRVEVFDGNLLNDPAGYETKSGTPFRVYTPFWKALSGRGDPPEPLPAPRKILPALLPRGVSKPMSLADLALLPTKPDWAGGLREFWTPGEAAAGKRLRAFLNDNLENYAEGRDLPAQDATTRLSPYLASGEISPRQIWHAVRAHKGSPGDAEKLLKELAWREFSYHLLFYNPDLGTKNFAARFDAFPWAPQSAKHLRAWQTGHTGYPIVDAGMRQLWQVGWMHNRVRLITGSFLVKHLLIDWREGEDWFWDTLCCADPANNAQNWQWVAGSGADAAPYFRIFNPILQGERFDPQGEYVKHFVPELRKVPHKYVHRPWEAPDDVLASAGVRLGTDYPAPIVDHGKARAAALAAFAQLRG